MPLLLHVATTNPGKLRDFEVAAKPHAREVQFVRLPGMERVDPPAEDGATFEENARIKAIRIQPPCTGNDRAGRRFGPGGRCVCTVRRVYAQRDMRLTQALIPNQFIQPTTTRATMRSCWKICEGFRRCEEQVGTAVCLAAARDGECIAVAHGTVEGTILEMPRGSGGFGYDPIFYVPELHLTMAEINLEEKYKISHRGHALRRLLTQLIPSPREATNL